jgi:hypothetical protein
LTWKHIRTLRERGKPPQPLIATLRADLRSGNAPRWPRTGESRSIRAEPAPAREGQNNPCSADTFCIHIGVLFRHARRLLSRKEKRSRPISRVLSRTIIHLGYVSPRTSSDLPGSLCGPHVPPHPKTGLLAPLFGLAPGGVCRAAECCHRRGALLPHPFTLTAPFAGGLAVCFLLHFPWARAPQALPGALPWEPGLSSTLARSDCLADSGRDGGGDQRGKQVICRAVARLRTAHCVCRP